IDAGQRRDAGTAWKSNASAYGPQALVGPPGFEPGTKGFAWSTGFPAARTISSPSAFAGGVRDAPACDQGHCSPQVVSAPSGGVPPAWLRVATVRAVARR